MLAPLPLVLKDRVIKKYTLFFLRDPPFLIQRLTRERPIVSTKEQEMPESKLCRGSIHVSVHLLSSLIYLLSWTFVHTRISIRLLNCFVLKTLFFIKTKKMWSLMQRLIIRLNWVERLDFSSVLQLLAVSTNSVMGVRIVLEFSNRTQSHPISIDTSDRRRQWASSKKSNLCNERQNEIAMNWVVSTLHGQIWQQLPNAYQTSFLIIKLFPAF